MSDQNTSTTAADQATERQATETEVAKLYATRAEVEANKLADAPKSLKVFAASKNGTAIGYLWGRGYADTLAALARKDGYAVSLGTSKLLTKESLTAALEAMSADERAAFLAKYVQAPAPAPAPTGKGKKGGA